MPLAIAAFALLGWWLVGLSLLSALLLAAILAPTDPTLAAALIGRKQVPARLWDLLNVESGLNDGLALPIVLVLLGLIGSVETTALHLVLEIDGGLLIGAVFPPVFEFLERRGPWRSSELNGPLQPIALALLVFSLCGLVGANVFVAAFAAGVSFRTVDPKLEEEFHPLGDPLAKLGALFVFGALVSPGEILRTSLGGWGSSCSRCSPSGRSRCRSR